MYNGYILTDSDNYYENDGSVLDMYSEKPAGADSYFYTHNNLNCGTYSGEGDCYNREHLMPQSVFSSSEPMVSDIHHVVPSDGYVNGRRSNYPFGIVTTPTWTSTNGSKVGNNSTVGYSNLVFEPIDEFKGDIARCMLYFATRYENQIAGWSHDMLNGTSNQVYTDWFLEILVNWHLSDPVNQREIDRNNAAYNYQGNRNPFIDHPEYVAQIWSATADTEAPTAPTNLIASNITNTTVDLNWTASTDNVGVTSYDIHVDGSLYSSSASNSTTLTGLTQNTSYAIVVYAKDAFGNTSGASNTVNITTTNVIDTQAPSAITDLIASNITSSSVALNWTASTDNVGVALYEIFVDGVLFDTSATNSFTATGLVSNTTYAFTVYAKDAAGNTSAVSNVVNATTTNTPTTCGLETFTNLGTNNSAYLTYNWVGDNSVSWTSTDSRNDQTIDGSRAITIRNGTLTSGTVANGISELTVTTQLVFSGSAGTFDVYANSDFLGTIPYSASIQTTTLTGFNISGDVVISFSNNSTASNRVRFDNLTWNCYQTTLGTEKIETNLVTVYPNPAKGNTFYISTNNSQVINKIEIFNLMGQVVYKMENTNNLPERIKIETIPSGMYLVKVSNNEAYSVKRLIIK